MNSEDMKERVKKAAGPKQKGCQQEAAEPGMKEQAGGGGNFRLKEQTNSGDRKTAGRGNGWKGREGGSKEKKGFFKKKRTRGMRRSRS
ncbi:MAG: hypothetical protein V8R91_11230 [Butyricimonas faecihominis]